MSQVIEKRYEVIKSLSGRPTKYTLIYLDFTTNSVIDIAYFVSETIAVLTAKLLNRNLEYELEQSKIEENDVGGYDG